MQCLATALTLGLTLGLIAASVLFASSANAAAKPGPDLRKHPPRASPTTTTTEPAGGRRSPKKPTAAAELTYDLAEANGVVKSLGGATYYGSAYGTHLVAPIVALVPTADRGGYWLIGADASVYPFGDAEQKGGAGGRVRLDPVVAAAATPDSGGYWFVTASGQVLAFGDARSYGSITSPLKDHVVAIAPTADGKGYWIASSTGAVYSFGDAKFHGSMATSHIDEPIVAIAATHDGGGYWLAESDGDVFDFGDAARLAPLYPVDAKSPVVGIAVTADGTGDWLAEKNGTVLNFGTATAHGSLTGVPANSPVISIAAMPIAAPPVRAPPVRAPPVRDSPLRYPQGAFGYDINWPQCAGPTSPRTVPLPGPPSDPAGTIDYTVAVIGVDGWAIGAPNPCLQAEVEWAKKADGTGGAPYDLYMFLNSPAASDTIDQTGPAGTCADFSGKRQARCLAYNYGYNSALGATQYATSQGATSPMWWLDIENDLCGQYWSCDPELNSLTIQGALDLLRAHGITVGIYSTSVQWKGITGGYVPPGPQIPIRVAGAYWTSPPYPSSYGYQSPSVLAPYCGAKYAFAGGTTWLLQETPGPNNYPFDPDYAC